MPVVPMVIVSALLMVIVSRLTSKPAEATINRYFSDRAKTTVESGETVASVKTPLG
jgi:hypothetical protein